VERLQSSSTSGTVCITKVLASSKYKKGQPRFAAMPQLNNQNNRGWNTKRRWGSADFGEYRLLKENKSRVSCRSLPLLQIVIGESKAFQASGKTGK
jgi:hypothetical protein